MGNCLSLLLSTLSSKTDILLIYPESEIHLHHFQSSAFTSGSILSCTSWHTSWKWLVYKPLPSTPWDSLATAKLIVMHSKYIFARCSQFDRAGHIATVQHEDIKQFILSIGLDGQWLCPIPSESSASVKQCQHNTVPLHMEAKADWLELHMGASQNLLWVRESWPPLCPGRPRQDPSEEAAEPA